METPFGFLNELAQNKRNVRTFITCLKQMMANRSVSILDLVCTTTEHNSRCLTRRAATKYVEPFIAYLLFLKYLTGTKYLYKRKKKEKEISLHSTPKFPVNNTSKKDNSTDHKQIKNVMLTSSMTLFTEV